MMYERNLPFFQATKIYSNHQDLQKHAQREKKSFTDSVDDFLTYDPDHIRSNEKSVFVEGQISAKIQGRKVAVIDSRIEAVHFDGAEIGFIDTIVNKVETESKAVFFNCSYMGSIEAEEVAFYDSREYKSINCKHLDTTLSNLHHVTIRSSILFHLVKGDDHLVFQQSKIYCDLLLTTPSVTLIDTSCKKITFNKIKGTVVLKGKSSVAEVANGTVIDERASLIEESTHGLKYSKKALRELESNLKRNIIGQDYAVTCVSDVIRRSLTGYGNPDKPLGVMLFAGPTGVGKTELTKALVQQLELILGKERVAYKRLDLAEYQRDYMIVQLSGAPRGYQDHQKGGVLTKFIKQNFANSHQGIKVLLLDEFEKMDADSRKYFLGLFDEGRVSDTEDNTLDGRNMIIIATTNLGGDEVVKYFQKGCSLQDSTSQKEVLKMMDPLYSLKFGRELLGRFQNIVFFHPIDLERVRSIITLKLQKFSKEILMRKKINIIWDNTLIDYLLSIYSRRQAFGVRSLDYIFSDELRSLLANAEVFDEVRSGDSITLFFDGVAIKYTDLSSQSRL
ncbi:MAG: AAA family ATPase [Chlamydiota bacterium]|nr:AAA family ATPase [Chlamydiota bacterium]